MHMFKTLLTTAFCLTALVSPVSAEYPDKPIRMVVGYAPGGAADKLVRPITDRLARCLLYTSPSPRDRTRSRMPSSA